MKDLKNDFEILKTKVYGKPLVYLDSAASSLTPEPVVAAIAEAYRSYPANVHRGAHFLSDIGTTKYEQSRETIKNFINAEGADEIIFTSGTTDSINLVAHSFIDSHLCDGNEILLTEMEHHSNIVPWQIVAKKFNKTIRFVPVLDNGDLDLVAYQNMVNENTCLVAFTMCSNTLGTVNPITEMTKVAHEKGAKVLVDAAQAVSSCAIDVQYIDCDFLAFSGHKVFGPFGIGVLYGKSKWLNQMPPFKGGGSMIGEVTTVGSTYLDAPHRFEAGTPHIAGVFGLARAIQYVQDVGLDEIRTHERNLLKTLIAEMKQIDGIEFIGISESKNNIVSFLMQGTHPSDVGALLDRQGVAVRTGHHCTQPLMNRFKISGTIRASLSLYNDEHDLEIFIQALKKTKEFF